MARKITLFELHFDAIHFGSNFGEEDDSGEEVRDEVAADSVSRRVVPVVPVIGAAVVAAVVGRRIVRRVRRSDDADEASIEMEEVDVDSPVEAVVD